MSIFKAPLGVLKKMESIRNKFFNGADLGDNKMTWIAWDKSDTWKGEVPFRDAFPRLFALETDKNVRVADKLVARVVSSFRRPVRGGREQQQWLDLASILATKGFSMLLGGPYGCFGIVLFFMEARLLVR
nr:RNA-directed DNA polymerase, eukaryota [Tanacetum cinerariifolium]